MRHLHETGINHTLCGLGRLTTDSVHVTKARKTDCPGCRRAFRETRATPGREIRKRIVRALAEASYPHDPDSKQGAFDPCEACAILADSIRLVASLENVR